jgi:membrane-associated PAP2 superfamily phosphatase
MKRELRVSWSGQPLFWLCAAFICIVLESIPGFDAFAQQPFFQDNEWLISKTFHNAHKLLFYTGPKVMLVCIGIAFFMLFGATFLPRFAKNPLRHWRKQALLILLSLAFIPLAVSFLKELTGVYSPVDLLPYGGRHRHMGFLSHLYVYGTVAGGRSFPAGHASGGFALMALYYLPVQKGIKKLMLCLGFLAGWSMGIYQMARGEHFLSHTLTTMFLALAIMTFWEKTILISKKSNLST